MINNKIEKEIKEKLNNWREIIKNYQIPDTRKAVIQLINTFVPFIGLWVLMYFSLDWSFWITLPLTILAGFFLARIFIIQHDCGHQSFLKSKKLNNTIGFICSFFSAIPYKYWAKAHSFHHGHNGQLDESSRDIGDVPFKTVKEFREMSRWGKFKYRIFRSPIVLFGIAPIAYIAISNRFPFYNLKGWAKERRSQIVNNFIMVGVYVLLGYLLGWKKFFLIQALSISFFAIIAFWFFYVQHQHEETYKQWKKNWDYLVASIRGSTYYKLPAVINWLTGSIGFHHIHHLSPRIPNYNLAKCAKENPILQKYVTTITFRESLKCAFNKLWDEELNRMITFREFYKFERVGRNQIKIAA